MSGTGDLKRLFKFLIWLVVIGGGIATALVVWWSWIWRDGFM